jgi:hypothetical protein
MKEVTRAAIDHVLAADDPIFDDSQYPFIVPTAAIMNLRNGSAAQYKWR